MTDIIDLRARERKENYFSLFHQSIALPKDLMKQLIDLKDKLDFGNYRFINQWRIDYPLGLKKKINLNEKTIFSIALKILNRGEYTSLSSFLENKLKNKFESNGNFNPYAYDLMDESKESTFLFDGSGYEKAFYENVFPTLLGKSFKRFVLPQVSFHSLVFDYGINSESKDSQERADFLITTNKKNIIVELDGEEHDLQKSKDSSRTRRLLEKNYEEIRIKNNEINNPNSPGMLKLKEKLSNLKLDNPQKSENDKFLNSFKIAQQIQITIVELLCDGLLDPLNRKNFNFDKSLFNEYTESEMNYIIEESLSDLKLLISNLSKLYDCKIDIHNIKHDTLENADIVITYNENLKSSKPLCIIQDISFPRRIAKELKEVNNLKIKSDIDSETLKFFLSYIFNHDDFREGQLESLKRTLMGKDTITLLPTGAGKSLIFQLATLLFPGITITIAPIKALMQDQVENLERRGISRSISLSGDIKSKIEKDKIQKLICCGQYLLIYVAPERFLIEDFRSSLRELTKHHIISLIVIDEAHCVSEWGHDFRPAYLTIGKNSRTYCQNKDGDIPPMIALTGTASENVLIDLKSDLDIEEEDAIISPETFDRKNLHFNLIKCNSDEKYAKVKEIIQQDLPQKLKIDQDSILEVDEIQTNSGIIFCPITSRGKVRGVDYFVNKINEDFGNKSRAYHSKEHNRIVNAKEFQNNEFPLLVATKGYGMGIDKPNIRYVIHINLPPSMETFYQEAGRAGRDRKNSECYIVCSFDDENKIKKLLDTTTGLDEVKNICSHATRDDVTSLFYFHNLTFMGKSEEMKVITGILDEIDDFGKEYQPFVSGFSNIDIKLSTQELFKAKQKAIFRLTAIGVVTNYGVDYGPNPNQFQLKINKITKSNIITHYYNYVKRYNQLRANQERKFLMDNEGLCMKEFIILCCDKFLDYSYEYYEKGRRQALSTMYSSLEKAIISDNPDKIFREELSNFFKRTYSAQLKVISNVKNIDEMMMQIKELFEGPKESDNLIKPVSDFKSLFGQTSRALEDSPESMGLFLLMACSRVKLNENVDKILRDIQQFISLSLDEYDFSEQEIYPILSWFSHYFISIRKKQGLEFTEKLVNKINDDKLTETLIIFLDKKNISLDFAKLQLTKKIYKELENNIYGRH